MKSHLEMAVASIQCFTDNGTLDLNELNFLLGLAMRDQAMDADEKRVLKSIFDQVEQKDVENVVWERMNQIKKQHAL